jgi:hypothetical protein
VQRKSKCVLRPKKQDDELKLAVEGFSKTKRNP